MQLFFFLFKINKPKANVKKKKWGRMGNTSYFISDSQRRNHVEIAPPPSSLKKKNSINLWGK